MVSVLGRPVGQEPQNTVQEDAQHEDGRSCFAALSHQGREVRLAPHPVPDAPPALGAHQPAGVGDLAHATG